ncbi:hypothetical protein [Nakamurella endophytica]|uniref:Uncharacterized protein n=1 Tax=Nakamurella endophytica TaxID=1748367 RepID=A0A917SWX7_9ACTN|nr:hypothetical protein [Nakamurella endophytica]GGM00064.1 hypothetical protein GCM10011594_20140 [Nakamurella endophytica]
MTESGTAGTPVPDSAMDTGSDAGAPGEHLPPEPLSGEDEQLLAALQDGAGDGGGDGAEPAVEDSPAVAEAADDDSVLPVTDTGAGTGEPAADPLTPTFTEPVQD